jgi:uncharacterized protein YeaO (DUF488 family)
MILLKRAYEAAKASDGKRFLVDRLWPRGLDKKTLRLHGWLKEVAPSNELRKSFCHDPKEWPEFQRRYFAELDAKPETWEQLLEAAREGNVTLVFGARDTEHNNAVALRAYLAKQPGQKRRASLSKKQKVPA